VDADHQWGIRCDKQFDQQQQQAATQFERRPFGTMKHPMVILELFFIGASHHPQDRSHGSLAWGQDRSYEQHVGPFPDPFAKDCLKLTQHVYNLSWQSQHLFFLYLSYERSFLCLSFVVWSFGRNVLNFSHVVYQMEKVYLENERGYSEREN